ncbi:suppressor of glycerol defect [Rhizina undulata]
MGRQQRTSTTRLPKELREELKLNAGDTQGSKRKRILDRKERRKQERQVKKQRRQPHASHGPSEELLRSESLAGAKVLVATAPSKPSRDVSPRPLKSILKKTKPVKKKQHDEDDEENAPRPIIRKAIKDQLEQDDAEIAYLEKKLKIKDNKKVPKSFEEDGLDFLLEVVDKDFLSDDKLSRGTKRKRVREPELEEDLEDKDEEVLDMDMDNEEDDFDDEEDDGLDDILEGIHLDLDETDEDENGEDPEGDEDDEGEDISDHSGPEEHGEFEGFSSDNESEQENISKGKELDPEPSSKEANTSKYIPPSLRKVSATESEQLAKLRRQIQGLLNRLSEANLLPILSDFEKLYSSNPRGHVTSILTDILISTICDRSSLLDTFMILHAGFVAGVYKLTGIDFGAHIVQRIVEDFDINYKKNNGIEDPATAGKECTNLMSFMSELYNFQVMGCVLMFDFVRMFLSEITELNTELLLKIARNSGHQLRQDDPAALKDLIVMMQPAIAKIGQAKLSTRTKFMIETLTNLKNNRLKSATASSAVTSEATIRMKKLLGSLNTRQLRASEPLRASLSDIRNTETKGKWWLVGASWVGNQATTSTDPQPSSEPKSTSKKSKMIATDDDDFEVGADLLQLAREQRMNTDVRRAIFVTIMSADDYTDAHTRLLKLRLKKAQEREIPRVLIHCCGAEPIYNPYYTLIARKLCGQHSLKMTFTFSLWELFRRMGEDDGGGRGAFDGDDDDDDDEEGVSMRRMINLAKMYGTLIAEGALTLSVLKTLNLAYLQTKTKTFLELMFITAILHSQRNAPQELEEEQKKRRDEKAVMDVFLKINDNVPLVRGVLFFLRKYVRNTDVAGGDEETATVKWGVGVASDALKAIVAREIIEG